MKNGVLSNFTRSYISSDRVKSGYEITGSFERKENCLRSRVFHCMKAFDIASNEYSNGSVFLANHFVQSFQKIL